MVALHVITQFLLRWTLGGVGAGDPQDPLSKRVTSQRRLRTTGLEASTLRTGRDLGTKVKEPYDLSWFPQQTRPKKQCPPLSRTEAQHPGRGCLPNSVMFHLQQPKSIAWAC